MKNFIQPGDVIDVTAGANIASGGVIVLNDHIAVATTNIANGSVGAALVSGVVQLPCVSANVIGVGHNLYWNGTALTLDADNGADPAVPWPYAGAAVTAAPDGVATVRVKLWG